jgi:hypothetical protein
LDTGLGGKVADQEFAIVLALLNYGQKDRAVYDPTIVSYDKAPFYIATPWSPELAKYAEKSCPDLWSRGDPYYNVNLDNSYGDPQPKTINSKNDFARYGVYNAEA